MNLHISKSKNAESFYICKSFVKANGTTSSMIVRKLGTLEQLLVEHGPTRDGLNRKTAAKSMGREKNTGQTRLSKWGSSWTGSPLHFLFSLETQTSRHR